MQDLLFLFSPSPIISAFLNLGCQTAGGYRGALAQPDDDEDMQDEDMEEMEVEDEEEEETVTVPDQREDIGVRNERMNMIKPGVKGFVVYT